MRWRNAVCRQVVIAAAFMLAVSACDDGPGPGRTVTFRVVSPQGAEGAALVEIVGRVDNAALNGPDEGWTLTRASGDTTWVFVALRAPGTLSFSVTTFAGSQPTARLLLVADGDNRLRVLDGYELEVQP